MIFFLLSRVLSVAQRRHILFPRHFLVFFSVNLCPLLQCVFLAFFAAKLSPRNIFSFIVTGSRWFGFTQRVFLHKWSIVNFSGIVPTSNS